MHEVKTHNSAQQAGRPYPPDDGAAAASAGTWSILHHQKTNGRASASPLVSVIIPSYNSSQHIQQCLQAVLAQRTDLPFEVILVDSSNDATGQIVAERFPQVRLFHFSRRRAVGIARNIGIEKARGEVILFLDTDCIAGPLWIDRMYSAIRDSAADGVGGSLSNGTPWSISGCIGFYLEFFRFLPCDSQSYATLFLVGGNCGFRREVFETARYPDRSTGDDLIFNWQLVNQRKRLLFLPSVSVTHLNKTGLANMLRYQYKLGLGACAYRHHVSPKIMYVLERLPLLAFLMPTGVVPWIGYTVLRRRGLLEFLKFLALLPLLLMANTVWATGFHQELKKRTTGA